MAYPETPRTHRSPTMRRIDRTFGGLMVLSGLLHCLGSYGVYKGEPMTLLWALSAGLAELLLAALNLLRAGRSRRQPDRPLAWICVAGNLAWLAVALIFGRLIGDLLDFRVLIQAGVTSALLLLSLRTLRRYRTRGAPAERHAASALSSTSPPPTAST